MDARERQRSGNTRGALVLLLLTALVALGAWRNRPSATREEAPREVGEVAHGEEASSDELLQDGTVRTGRPDIHVTVLHPSDAGR